jgi:16S rRNA (uracil1498-N3)-methyltransferase
MRTIYLAPEGWQEPYIIRGDEAKHLIRVLRAKPGDRLRLFDGRGRHGVFTVEAVDGKNVGVTPVEIHEAAEPESTVHVALAWGKAARRDLIFEKAVELGAASIMFWQAERSQGKIPSEPKPTWRVKCIAAAKQSENPRLPELAVFAGVRELLEHSKDFEQRYLPWEELDAGMRQDLSGVAAPGRTIFVIGPEGGMSEAEAKRFTEAGFTPISLGSTILRWETAALFCLTLFKLKQEKLL